MFKLKKNKTSENSSSKMEQMMKEEQIHSPFRTILNTFVSNKISMTALIVFLLIFAVVSIGPFFMPVDLGAHESSQINTAPGMNLMSVPKEMEGKIADISIGPTFSVGADTDGKLYVWGKTKFGKVDRLKTPPKTNKKIVKVAAGYDHALALTDDGEVIAWGMNNHQQATVPASLTGVKVVDIFAGYLASACIDENGDSHYFGNTLIMDFNEYNEYQGKLKKIAFNGETASGLTKDGDVVFLGSKMGVYSKVPEGKFIDIAGSASAFAAIKDDGKIVVWGNTNTLGDHFQPEFDKKAVAITGGRYHFTALFDDGSVASWGMDNYGQTNYPKNINADHVYAGGYQNLAAKDGKIVDKWGLKGYLLGTDELGRDIFTRLLNGGRMTMTIGAVAVIISTIIGVIVGGVSGYFGGKVDMFLQRVAEIFAALPFLPFAIILNALIGNSMSPKQRIYLIMVVLGVLSWTGLQRLVRAQVLSVREQEYVTAAKSVGIKTKNIVFKHILPNVVSVIIVSTTLSFASSMLTESTLSFLGFGVQPPIPTWGNMLNGANRSTVIQNYWWQWVYTSIILGVCVICINLIGDGLRDAIDPRSQER